MKYHDKCCLCRLISITTGRPTPPKMTITCLNGYRLPTTIIICAAVLFILYLFPWHQLSSVRISVPPSPSTLALWQQYPDNYELGEKSSTVLSILLKSTPVPGLVSYRTLVNSEPQYRFNASLSDVMVLLHMQKTGGTAFEKHVVQDLDMEQPCVCWKRRKRCKCARTFQNNGMEQFYYLTNIMHVNIRRKIISCFLKGARKSGDTWLFSRFSTGWICGLHADWTELTSCVKPELEKAYGSHIKRR